MGQAEELVNNEYNAFGPWILEVTDENPMPALFLPYYKENQDYLMLIKIPRKVDRRNAKPGMDLYDYVVGMYETYGYILTHKGKEVYETKFYYDKVEGIENYADLLLGRLTIHLKSDTLIIPYNAVSKEIIFQLVKIIRDRYTKAKYESTPMVSRIEKSKITETLYINLINKMDLQGDALNIMAFQPDADINNTGRLGQKVLGLIRPKLLLSSIHLLNDKELLVINRGMPIKYKRDAAYSYCFTYIPLGEISSIEFQRCKEYNNFQIVCIRTSKSTFMFYFDERNENLMDFYKDLAVSYSLQ